MDKKFSFKGTRIFWQGHKDSNSGHAVLETAALPTELYPYIITDIFYHILIEKSIQKIKL